MRPSFKREFFRKGTEQSTRPNITIIGKRDQIKSIAAWPEEQKKLAVKFLGESMDRLQIMIDEIKDLMIK